MKHVLSVLFLTLVTGAVFAQDNSGLVNDRPIGNPPLGAALLSCDGSESIYGQSLDPANFGNATTSDAEIVLELRENAVDAGGNIVPFSGGDLGSLRTWGLTIEFDPAVGFVATCLEDNAANTQFNVTLYADNAGTAGAVVSTGTATPVQITDTGIAFAFTTIFEFDLVMDAPISTAGASWISIQRQTGVGTAGGNQCLYLAVNETTPNFDDFSEQIDTTTSVITPQTFDHTFCMEEAAAAPAPETIPTLDWRGMALMILVLGAFGYFAFGRRKQI